MKRTQQVRGLQIAAATIASIVFGSEALAEDRYEKSPLRYSAAEQIATLQNEDILESSGIVASRRTPGVFWTHNDSGAKARIYSFDKRGRHLGRCTIKGAAALDWEDIAAFKQGDQCWLVLCDVGDNAKRRDEVELIFIHEPAPAAKTAKIQMTVRLRYSRGPLDCEAVAVDAHTKSILLIGKSLTPPHVFVLPLPQQSPSETLIAKSLGRIPAPLVTGMDISHDGRRLIAGTYGDAFEFVRRDGESWQETIRRAPAATADARPPPRRSHLLRPRQLFTVSHERTLTNSALETEPQTLMYEVEQKYRLADVAAFESKLRELGVDSFETIEQVDTYLAHPSRDFGETDEAFRVRRVGELNFVTYKGRKIDATTKTRREIELPLPDGAAYAEDFKRLQEALGFQLVAEVHKVRKKSHLRWQEADVEIVIDDVTGVGWYTELEIVADESEVESAKAHLASLAEELNLQESERRSYLELLRERAS